MGSAQGSFESFVDTHAAELLRTACLITWDESEAEDLVQECLLRVAQQWPRIRAMSSPLAFSRKIVVNLALNGRTRRLRRRSELVDADTSGSPDLAAANVFELVGTRDELIGALGLLSRQQRTVLGLRYFLDLSEAQVADALGCTIGTVKTSASRGLNRMRELIADHATEVCEQ